MNLAANIIVNKNKMFSAVDEASAIQLGKYTISKSDFKKPSIYLLGIAILSHERRLYVDFFWQNCNLFEISKQT